MLKRYKCGLVLLVAVNFALSACVASSTSVDKSSLELLGDTPLVYQCESGARIVAKYYSLSDGSLNFVKVTMPSGKQYTLPNVISASGARYTDEVSMVWWTKGDNAFAEARDQDGQWQVQYKNCKQIFAIK
ncbi:MAG: MliC family protein [Oceanisphaera sp.]|uniref:MliC family protein n=1 Tax=Oceanisphaera sp. TaxID=1929979 RepID=UPI003F9A0C1E